jgi:hypothetical protein
LPPSASSPQPCVNRPTTTKHTLKPTVRTNISTLRVWQGTGVNACPAHRTVSART